MTDDDAADARRRIRRRLTAAGATLLVVAAAGAAAVVITDHGGARAPATPAKIPVATAQVVKTDLSDTQTLPGTLGYGAERPMRGTGTGVVTRLPKPGAAVVRGAPLYWVNDRPVMVFYGDTPLFRDLDRHGLRGRDVTVVVNNLRALGYDPGPQPTGSSAAGSVSATGQTGQTGQIRPGDVLTDSARAALKRWQRDHGLTANGTLRAGEIVVLPGRARVGSVKAQLGDPAAAEILTVTPTAKVVTVPMDPVDAGSIRRGARAAVVLPNGKKITGRVTAIGKTVQGGTDATGQNQDQLNVTVTPLKSSQVRTLDAAPVEVRFTSMVRRGVLAVPVGALLALREGGYALQLPDGRLLAVTTGMFARGMVQVSGPQITAGLTVVTSS